MQRKKRAEKSIESLESQINLHKAKQKNALESGNEELYEYYNKELKKFEDEIKRKKKIFEK
ncbi:hypothetical protein J4409_00505 [Candidatus Woesearchaeota archaeon]|nr:hypothetical protein [Candidatus Woesearchaeota archaeon]